MIGVSGVNLHAHAAGVVLRTHGRDVFPPPDADDLVRAWQACGARDLELLDPGSA